MNKNEEQTEDDIVSPVDWDKIIEEKIENKFNQVMDILPKADNVQISKRVYEYTLSDIYNGTIQTTIDVINETTDLMSERKYLSNQKYSERLLSIFFKEDRRYFIGVILILLSFIIYFIDGSSI